MFHNRKGETKLPSFHTAGSQPVEEGLNQTRGEGQVWGLGFRDWDFGWGLGFSVQGFGLEAVRGLTPAHQNL